MILWGFLSFLFFFIYCLVVVFARFFFSLLCTFLRCKKKKNKRFSYEKSRERMFKGKKWAYFDKRSTTTNIVSFPLELGSPYMKSIDIASETNARSGSRRMKVWRFMLLTEPTVGYIHRHIAPHPLPNFFATKSAVWPPSYGQSHDVLSTNLVLQRKIPFPCTTNISCYFLLFLAVRWSNWPLGCNHHA